MQNLKTTLFMLMAALTSAIIYFSACKSPDKAAPPVVKTSLNDSITAAVNLLANSFEGKNDGQYPAASRASLQAAIDAAKSVSASSSVSQDQANAALVSLRNAMNVYRSAKITPIAPESLIANWTFSEGTGTAVTDISPNKFAGVFKAGPVSKGAGVPAWTADRYNTPNRAIIFDRGANIEVPYSTKLNPKSITIALWIKCAKSQESNRFMGMHSWLGYKFELQSKDYLYFTAHSAKDTKADVLYAADDDCGAAVPLNEWHHVAVTLSQAKLVFYIDGVKVKEGQRDYVEVGDMDNISDDPYPLVFGQDVPTSAMTPTDANYAADHKIPEAWSGFFIGSMDEIRLYNVALTDSQIQSIYEREKP